MKFSIRFNNDLPAAEYVTLARAAEAAGFDQFWLSNDLFLRSAPVILSAIAGATERIEIGTCILNPYSIDPAEIAMMAATLSNMGRHPLTGCSAYSITHVKDMLSIMFTCGMYDYSGQWAYRVGVPAKSGVSGGVITVVNRQLGVGTYSPRLDPYGNSCRGTEVCVDLASRLGLHVFDCLNVGSSFLDAIL